MDQKEVPMKESKFFRCSFLSLRYIQTKSRKPLLRSCLTSLFLPIVILLQDKFRHSLRARNFSFSFHSVTSAASFANLQEKGYSIQGQLISQCEIGHILKSFNNFISWKVAHAFVTERTSRAKAGGKRVKSIACWCLRQEQSWVTAETKTIDDRDIWGIGCQCHTIRNTHLLVFPPPITSMWVLAAPFALPPVPYIFNNWVIAEFFPYL